MKREHLFITTKHFENCHKFQIFGVGKASINQFGLVNKGDKVFFLSKDDNLIIGPYEVISEIFYNEEIIWQEKDGIDAYPYRVRLRSDKLYGIDGNIFSQIIEENNIRIDSGDLGQKSVFTFLPKDIGIIEPILKEKGIIISKPIEEKEIQERGITISLAKSHGFTEAFLEFFLLKNFDKFFGDIFIPYNQFRINLLGSKIDIIAISENIILVLELKKDTIKEKDIRQFKDYMTWSQNNKTLLGRFFKINLEKAKIQNKIIGSGVQRNLNVNNSIIIKKYSLKNNELIIGDI